MGKKSSEAVAMAAHFGLHCQGSIADLNAFLSSEGLMCWDKNWNGSVSVNAYDTVSAVLAVLSGTRSLDEVLRRSVSFGGDTDSVASIAVGLASCFSCFEKNLSSELSTELDELNYGLDYLAKLEAKLLKKYALSF